MNFRTGNAVHHKMINNYTPLTDPAVYTCTINSGSATYTLSRIQYAYIQLSMLQVHSTIVINWASYHPVRLTTRHFWVVNLVG